MQHAGSQGRRAKPVSRVASRRLGGRTGHARSRGREALNRCARSPSYSRGAPNTLAQCRPPAPRLASPHKNTRHGPGRASTDRSRRERDGDGSQKAALGPGKANASAVCSHARPRDTPRYAARCAEIVFTARSHRVGRGGAPLMQTRRRPRRRRRRAARATRARRGAYRTVRGTASLSDS